MAESRGAGLEDVQRRLAPVEEGPELKRPRGSASVQGFAARCHRAGRSGLPDRLAVCRNRPEGANSDPSDEILLIPCSLRVMLRSSDAMRTGSFPQRRPNGIRLAFSRAGSTSPVELCDQSRRRGNVVGRQEGVGSNTRPDERKTRTVHPAMQKGPASSGNCARA